MEPQTDVPVLEGRLVRLVPLSLDHVDDLAHASAERGTYSFAAVPDGRPATEAYVQQRLARHAGGDLVPFAQIRISDDRAVGCTCLLNFRRWPDTGRLFAVEVGGTWLGRLYPIKFFDSRSRPQCSHA